MKTWGYLAGLALLAGGLALWNERGEGQATESKPAPALPADLAGVPGKGVFLVSVRPADLWKSELGKGVRAGLGKLEKPIVEAIERQLGLRPVGLERVTVVMTAPQADPLFLCRAAAPLDSKTFLTRLLPDGKPEKHAGKEYRANARQAVALLGERGFVVGGKGDVQSVLERKSEKGSGGLVPAVALATKGHSLVIGANPGKLPAPAEVGPFGPLLKARAASLTVDLGTKSSGRSRVTFASVADAIEGQKALELVRGMGQQLLAGLEADRGKDQGAPAAALKALLGQVRAALKTARFKRDGKEVTGSLEMKLDPATAGKAAVALALQAQEAARRGQSVNKLKQIGLALHNYHSKTGAFPARAIFDKNGKPILSWRVLLLPDLDEAVLYDQFKLDEPWDSAHNKKLLAKLPAVYRAPASRPVPDGYTFYQAFVGKDAAFEGKKGMRVTDFTDGTSNTIMVAEAAKAVAWTKPEDLNVEAGKPLPKLGGLFENGFYVLVGDGSVRFFRKTIKPATLRQYITRNDGQVIPNDE